MLWYETMQISMEWESELKSSQGKKSNRLYNLESFLRTAVVDTWKARIHDAERKKQLFFLITTFSLFIDQLALLRCGQMLSSRSY